LVTGFFELSHKATAHIIGNILVHGGPVEVLPKGPLDARVACARDVVVVLEQIALDAIIAGHIEWVAAFVHKVQHVQGWPVGRVGFRGGGRVQQMNSCGVGMVGVANTPQHFCGWRSGDKGGQEEHLQVRATGQGARHSVEFARLVLNVQVKIC
jgi:hypothetical protein